MTQHIEEVLQIIEQSIRLIEVWDIIDMAIVAYVIYRVLLFIRKSRSGQVAKAIIILLAALVISSAAHLKVINFVLSSAVELGFIALVIVFQPELRRFLERIGSGRLKEMFATRFTLANFLRAQLYSTMATLKLGMDILAAEGTAIDSLTGHGGLFKTPVVGQKYLAAACGAPVTCLETAGEGGPYGMALLAAYRLWRPEGETLEEYLRERVFAGVSGSTVRPDQETAAGFEAYMERYRALLDVERAAVEVL